MKKIGEIKNLKDLYCVLEKIENYFTMTDLSVAKTALQGAEWVGYSYYAKSSVSTEGSYGRPNSVDMEITLVMYPSRNGETMSTGRVDFTWITSSEHKVHISCHDMKCEGQPSHMWEDPQAIEVFIGEEESEVFYPAFRDIIA